MRNVSLFILAFTISFTAISWDASALRISLKRIIFEGSKRAESITVMNSSSRPVTYRVGWRHFQMTEDEALVPIKNGEPLPAGIKPVTEMVRFAPRRFTLPPFEAQQVRLMLRRPKGLEDGEYRSHLWVRPEADLEDLKRRQEANKGKGTGVVLKMLTAVTMPVIVRKGNLSATVSFEEVSAADRGGKIDIDFSLVREGERSIYGDIILTCNPGVGGYELETKRGLAMYAEASKRNFSVSVDKQPDKAGCGEIGLSFVEKAGPTDEVLGVVATSLTSVK